MPRIPDDFLRSTLWLYPTEEAARAGERVGGCGFLATQVDETETMERFYVVTNAHVADHCKWVRVNTDGGVHVLEVPVGEWTYGAPDDIAVAPVTLPNAHAAHAISLRMIALTEEDRALYRVGPGDEVFMCGRYLGHDAADRNVPTARFGNVSLMADQTRPVRDGRRLEVEAHLVEMRSQAGFSGSPVFVIIPADSFRGEFNYRPEDPDYRTLTRFRCIGIDTGHKRELLPVIDPVTGERRDDVVVQANSGVAIVAPIRKVIDLLNSPALVAERNVVAKAWRTANPDA